MSKFSSYKGDAFTGTVTQHLNCVFVSANTVCHTIALCTLRRKTVHSNVISRSTIIKLLSRVAVAFQFGPRHNTDSVCIGNSLTRNGVQAVRIDGYIDRIDTVPTIHHGLITVRRRVKHHHNIIVSNHSVNAIMFPSTRLGVFVATSPGIQTYHHCSRLHTGNSSMSLRRVRHGIHRHSGTSVDHTVSPLQRTSSTIILSGDYVAIRRRVT